MKGIGYSNKGERREALVDLDYQSHFLRQACTEFDEGLTERDANSGDINYSTRQSRLNTGFERGQRVAKTS